MTHYTGRAKNKLNKQMATFIKVYSGDNCRTMHVNLEQVIKLSRLDFPSKDKQPKSRYFLNGEEIDAAEYQQIKKAIEGKD